MMAEADPPQIDVLFEAVLARAVEDRADFLASACKGDEVLRTRIERMLALTGESIEADDSSHATGPRASLAPAESAPQPPGRIGRYSIRREIASGGMGTVYEAVQEKPHRTVALKVMRRGVASRSALRRFEYESQILARLRHPHIAQVFEAGTHDDGFGGVPFFAMEYIPSAKALTEFVSDKGLNTRMRLTLFVKVCAAVQHGHQKGIIHRDLKPSNILVDFEGEPKIIDFGVARATDSDMAVTTLQTDVGQLIGTLQYMSPEQCAADPHDLDSRSDVYALGVVLYELLCGDLPYDVSGVPVIEAARVIREQTPTRLSATNRMLRGDVETIALKALDKDRTRRYQTAADLAADINRHLSDQPIVARPPSAMYQLRKFARRNKLLVGGLATLILVLAVATVVSTIFWRDAVVAARGSDAANLRAVAQLQTNRTEALAYLLASLELEDRPETRRLILERLWEGPTELRLEPAHAYYSIDFSPDGRSLAVENERTENLAKAQGLGLLWPSDGGPPTKLRGTGVGQEIRIGRDSEHVFQAIDKDRRRIGIWSLADGRFLRDINLEGRTFFSLSQDGQRVFTSTDVEAGDHWDLTFRSWPVDGGNPTVLARMKFKSEAEVLCCKVDPTGTKLAWSDDRNAFVTRLGGDPDRLEHSAPLPHDRFVWGMAFDPSGELLATVDDGGETKVWSVNGDAPTLMKSLRASGANGLRFGGSNAVLADGLVRLDAPPDASPIRFPGANQAKALHPDGRWLATGAYESYVSLWPLPERFPWFLARYPDHNVVYDLIFTPDGRWIVSAGGESLRIWPRETEPGERSRILYLTEEPYTYPTRVVAEPNGEFVVACFLSGAVRIVPLDGGPVRELEPFTTDTVWALAISPDGRLVAAGSGNFAPDDAVISVWDLEADEVTILDAGDREMVDTLEFTPQGTLLASSAGTLRLWDLRRGTYQVLDTVPVAVADRLTGATFDLGPDGSSLLAVHEGKLFLHDLEDHTAQELSTHGAMVVTAVFDGTGDIVVSTDEDGVVRVGRVNGATPHLLLGRTSTIGAVAVSPDNLWIAAGSSGNGAIRLWPMPDVDSTPLHALPRPELIAKLKSLTNLRVVRDPSVASGWTLEIDTFPGWETVPTW